MASCFEIVDEEYIEELKDKSENENKKIARSGERTFSKNGRMKESCKQILKSTRRMSSTNDCRSFKNSEMQ